MMSGNEEAEQKELMEMFMGHKVTGAHPARVWDCENRPLSSVSTSAGATPSLDEQCGVGCSTADLFAEASHLKMVQPRPFFCRSNTNTSGTIGAFQDSATVAGPSDPGAEDFYWWHPSMDDNGRFGRALVIRRAFFSSFGAVSKAWLQRQRADNGSGHGHSSIPVHRGFGFVVFQDPSTVDELLGSDPSASRFMELQDGKRIEVKRAKTSTDMTHEKQTYTADTSFKAAGPSTMETKGQKGQVQSQWQTCTPQHQNQNVSNGNNAVRAETNGLASFWSPNPWSCNTAVPQPMLMPWFGDVKGGEKMVNSKPCQLEPLHEQQM
ncbi:unnamed protein product [Cladocopium goreaui]|uniref:Heterogeneous nuclear ribonucleoprotein A0 n=1 Tax=Cladocopium goreaui TaxID=2562237 RepID=A0A9P1DW82_9DINO|nr:unnamed protein product [Cladocopium goreaui]